MHKNFRTTFQIPPSGWKIGYDTRLLSLGSCFAENIGGELAVRKLPILANPFGLLYNPISIATALEMLLEGRQFTKEDLFEHQGLWHSPFHHGDFSAVSLEACLANINEGLQAATQRINNCDILLLTLGTAHAFWHKERAHIVANCHKLPGVDFERRLLTQEEIVHGLSEVLGKLRVLRPDLQVIFTVSPVRYLRDGLVSSNRSKATLLLAVHELCDKLPYTHYFPAYELVVDDLRDYRFFAEDMAHPSAAAVAYVWDSFQATYFDENTRKLSKKILKIKTNLSHRPLRLASEAHQLFLQKQKKAIENLCKEHPFLDFKEEMIRVRDALTGT